MFCLWHQKFEPLLLGVCLQFSDRSTAQDIAGFDNVAFAMLSVFQSMTLNGWSFSMYRWAVVQGLGSRGLPWRLCMLSTVELAAGAQMHVKIRHGTGATTRRSERPSHLLLWCTPSGAWILRAPLSLSSTSSSWSFLAPTSW